MKFAFILAEKANYPVALSCRLLGVSRSGFYAWRNRLPSQRERRDRRLQAEIAAIHKGSQATYGSPRIHRALRERHKLVSRKRVARLMREAGLEGVPRRRFRRTTDSSHTQPVAPNVLDRQFEATRPNQAWVGDITYVRTWEGWLYLSVLVDLFSRRVVGWAVADHLGTGLVERALDKALGLRRPEAGLVHHSDRGCQYASARYRAKLAKRGICCSMSRRGNCWDNAVAESFFGTLKTELIHRHSWPTRRAAAAAIGEYIELFYNSHRLHSSLDFLSPADYEAKWQKAVQAA